MNDNSRVLQDGKWSNFFIGFDNIPEHVSNESHDKYKVGIIAGEGSGDKCIMDVNAASPPESQSRVLPRKPRRQALRQALKSQRTTTAKERYAELNQKIHHLDEDTVFIAAGPGVEPFYG